MLALAIPRKLHLHAPVLLGVDLVARRTHHHRRLRSLDDRLRRRACRPEPRFDIDGLDGHRHAVAAAAAGGVLIRDDRMLGPDNHIFRRIEGILRVVGEPELRPRPQPAAIGARAMVSLEPHLGLGQAQVCHLRDAVGCQHLRFRRVVEYLESRMRVGSRLARRLQQRLAWLLEVKIGGRVDARLHGLFHRPAIDRIRGGPRAPRLLKPDLVVAGRRLEGGGVIGKHHGVLAVLMLEEIKNPGGLHQPAQEVEIRLPILHAVLERLILAGERQLVIAETMPLGDRFEDLLDGFVLKDAAIGRAAQEPEPGLQPQLVAEELPRGLRRAGRLLAGADKAGHQAIEGARGACARESYLHRHRLSE